MRCQTHCNRLLYDVTLQVRQSTFYDNIMKTQRPRPEYFRVGFYGLGFPSFLQNKEFVYRGNEYDKLSDFSGRLQNLYPNASVRACVRACVRAARSNHRLAA